MGKSPKFMVFHLKELIYTLVFVLLGIVLIMLWRGYGSISLIFMFCNKNQGEKETKTTNSQYEAGVYTSQVTLNGNPMEISVTLDNNHINAITVTNVSDTISTMYPLVQPAFDDIANQIVDSQSVKNVKFSKDSKYTYTMLYDAIVDTINKGKK